MAAVSKEKTGVWTWLKSHETVREYTVTADDILYVRSLVAGWDIAETGAPGLVTASGDWLTDDVFENDPQKELLLSEFFPWVNCPQ